MPLPEPILEFSGNNRFLSNFYIEPDETCVEAEYQAAKTHSLEDKARILECLTNPRDAKKMGQKVNLRRDWENVKLAEMRALVMRKFFDHQELAVKLIQTKDAFLMEGNMWHDNFWGQCRCDECEGSQIEGLNWLGEVLMEVRKLINSYA